MHLEKRVCWLDVNVEARSLCGLWTCWPLGKLGPAREWGRWNLGCWRQSLVSAGRWNSGDMLAPANISILSCTTTQRNILHLSLQLECREHMNCITNLGK